MLQEDVLRMTDRSGQPVQLSTGCVACFQKRSSTLAFTFAPGTWGGDNRFYYPDGDDKRALPTPATTRAECKVYMDIVSKALGRKYMLDHENADSICFVLT